MNNFGDTAIQTFCFIYCVFALVTKMSKKCNFLDLNLTELIYMKLAGLPGFARDSCRKIISITISPFYF